MMRKLCSLHWWDSVLLEHWWKPVFEGIDGCFLLHSEVLMGWVGVMEVEDAGCLILEDYQDVLVGRVDYGWIGLD